MSEDKKVEQKVATPRSMKKPVDVEAWKKRKLKAINAMKNPAKAKQLAEIVMRKVN